MRKSLFLTVALSLCVANFGAFAATTRSSGRTNPNATAQNAAPKASTAARAAARQVGPKGTAQGTQKQVAQPVLTVKNTANNSGAQQKVTGARAAATKKALNMGTKVATATENTVVSQECQNAYYGCMDAFCMLDNASGGRCQCNDKITELDNVLAEIMKLDEQSMRIATEGVETVEMGEYADQIKSRTKSIENELTTQEKKTENKKKKTLDLSAWNNSDLFDDENIFDDLSKEETIADISSKTGDALYKDAAKICTKQIPAECKANSTILQMTYSQKIRSDCTGYENSLKQRRTESAQKLQTAQKAVRDAVLEDVKNKNKYATEGECVVAFDQCMQTTAGCGSDYTGCVADDTVLMMDTTTEKSDGSKTNKVETKQIATSASKIGISANTLAMLTDKAPVCESVLKQCENVRKNVWSSYLKMIVPTLKSAEVIAEQDRRMNCIGNIVDCFSKACAAKWPDQESAEYDMCLADPSMVSKLCKTQIERCSVAGTGDDVMEYVKAKLSSMRVDACTKQVKDCLQSEDSCGSDYSGCVGLDTKSIVALCPVEKLTACAKGGKYENSTEITNYVAEIAKGLAMQIDNNLLTKCQEAVNKAFVDVCGDEEYCNKISFDLSSIKSSVKVQACSKKEDGSEDKCRDNLLDFRDEDIYAYEYKINWDGDKIKSVETTHIEKAGYGVFAKLAGRPDISSIIYSPKPLNNGNNGGNNDGDNGGNNDGDVNNTGSNSSSPLNLDYKNFAKAGNSVLSGFDKSNTEKVIKILDGTLNGILKSIASDPTVNYCMTGRKIEGMDGDKFGSDTPRFENLLDNKRAIIASSILSALVSKNLELEKTFETNLNAMNSEISKRMGEIAEARGAEAESLIDAYNAELCMCDANNKKNSSKSCYASKDIHTQDDNRKDYRLATAYIRQLTDVEGEYDAKTNVCTLKTKQYSCDNYISPSCRKFDEGKVLNTSTVQMQKFR